MKDAPLMLEWMHDEDVCEFMKANFASKALTDCENFIRHSLESTTELHMAVVNDADEYMGTVSLKNIDTENGEAEFAITMRRAAMGKGYSAFGMRAIIRLGLTEMHLKRVLWCVLKINIRANRFYDKNMYPKMESVPEKYKKLYPEWEQMNWYYADIKVIKEA